MNQLYRALHIPPKRLLRKLSGEKEIYTIAVRPVPKAEGTDPLPALGGTPYTMLPPRPGFWYADPLLYHRDGRRWLYAEAMDLATGLGRIEVCELHDDGTAGEWQVALQEDFHLSFPTVFDWNGETWMIPETGPQLAHLPLQKFPGRVGAGAALCRGRRTLRYDFGQPHPQRADPALQRDPA